MRTIAWPLLILCSLASCNPFPGPRKVDLKKEWAKSGFHLKTLAQQILQDPAKFQFGNNEFPDDFEYPFDDGFFLNYGSRHSSTENIQQQTVTIKFYTDRGLLDHYSAIIFTNNPIDIGEFESNVANGGNDYKLEEGWYAIND